MQTKKQILILDFYSFFFLLNVQGDEIPLLKIKLPSSLEGVNFMHRKQILKHKQQCKLIVDF